MDSLQWHRQATAMRPPPPVPITAGVLGGASQSERRMMASSVLAELRGTPIPSVIHDRVSESLDRALEFALAMPPGMRTIPALSAPFALGKSTLVKQWASRHHRAWVRDAMTGPRGPAWFPEEGWSADLVPVCYLSLLAATKSKDLYSQVLGFFGYPEGGAERALAGRAVAAFANHRTRLVVLDDAHMLRTSSVTGRQTLDAVKHLATELGEVGGVLVLVGADLEGGVVFEDRQIRGRLKSFQLTPYHADTADQRRDWQLFLRQCESRVLPYLPLNRPGDLVRCAPYLWFRSQGYVGDAIDLIAAGTVDAISNGVALDRRMLEDAADAVSARAADGHAALRPKVIRQRAAG